MQKIPIITEMTASQPITGERGGAALPFMAVAVVTADMVPVLSWMTLVADPPSSAAAPGRELA
ncbi:hypothetical protein GCM10010319_28240 [Streptomyces blastmyceticus]|uniref:Cullin-7 n=1 Tax=Streptomyces blastmyceticus TaxID=68180 RepID=A0A077K7N4_9ACTN|nr:cullin-7 [Streptomyces blastmyceticus]